MAFCDVFLNFATCYTRKNFPETVLTFFHDDCTIFDDEEQCEATIMEDSFLSQLEDLRFICVSPLGRFASSVLYWDEIVDITSISRKMKWSNFGAFNTQELLVSTKYGSVYRGEHGMGKMLSRKKAAAMDAITVELFRNLAAKKVNKIPRSVFCCYVDSFLNSQIKKGISSKGAATDGIGTTLNVPVRGEFTSFVSKWENLKFLNLHLASSTRQLQPYPKMFTNASKLPFISHPRASKSEEISILNSGHIKGMDATYNWYHGLSTNCTKMNITKQVPPAHPPPKNDIFIKNNHMARKTSTNSLLVTICMVTTFVAALGFSSSTFKDAYSTSKDLITSHLIIAINTLVFIVSLVMDIFLLHKSTYKWELQITLFALFGAYICLMKVMVPQAAFPLFLLSVPFLFFAAA